MGYKVPVLKNKTNALSEYIFFAFPADLTVSPWEVPGGGLTSPLTPGNQVAQLHTSLLNILFVYTSFFFF